MLVLIINVAIVFLGYLGTYLILCVRVCFNVAHHTHCWKVRIRNSVCFSIAWHIVLTIFDNVFLHIVGKLGFLPLIT